MHTNWSTSASLVVFPIHNAQIKYPDKFQGIIVRSEAPEPSGPCATIFHCGRQSDSKGAAADDWATNLRTYKRDKWFHILELPPLNFAESVKLNGFYRRPFTSHHARYRSPAHRCVPCGLRARDRQRSRVQSIPWLSRLAVCSVMEQAQRDPWGQAARSCSASRCVPPGAGNVQCRCLRGAYTAVDVV